MNTSSNASLSPLRPLFSDIASIEPALASGSAVLTPNRRLSRAVRAAEHRWRQEKGSIAWPSSTIMPIAQYWTERWRYAVTRGVLRPACIIEDAAQRVMWETVVEEESTGFSLLSPSRAAAFCQQALRTLLLWDVDIDSASARQAFDFDDDGRAFLVWSEKFLAALRERELLLPEQAWQQLLQQPDTLNQSLALLHVEELPPLYRALCDRAPAWEVISSAAAKTRAVPATAFGDSRAELQAAARWCHARHRDDPQGRYAVVLSDMRGDRDRLEYFLRQEFGCLTSAYASLPVNFATGFNLDRTPLIRDALAILECSASTVVVEQFIALLQSSFVRRDRFPSLIQEGAGSALRDLAREQIPQRVLRQVLSDLARPVADRASQELDHPEQHLELPWQLLRSLEGEQGLRRRKKLPSAWIALFNEIFDSWGWPKGRPLDSLEYQQFQQWRQALETFAGLDRVCGALGFESAFRRLRTVLADQLFQPQTEDQGLQVLGPLETTGLYFDGLWIVGMSSAQWPPPARPNPYIPMPLQRQLKMPHIDAKWEWNWCLQRWHQWLTGSGQLQLSFVNQQDGVELLPVPLPGLSTVRVIDEPAQPDPRWDTQAVTGSHSVALPAIALQEQEPSMNGVGSYALEHQANCPFRAYAAVRLRVDAQATPALGLLPAERGTLLHRALYHLFGTFPDRARLRDADENARLAAIEFAVADAFKGLQRERRLLLGSLALDLELRRLQGLLMKWLCVEEQRETDYAVSERECSRKIVLGGLQLRLRLDRVDTLDTGEQLLIDYKSGRAESLQRWFETRPSRPQLPLYALLDPPAAGVAYALLRPDELTFSGVAQTAFAPGLIEAAGKLDSLPEESTLRDDRATEDRRDAMQVLREHWLHELTVLAQEFVQGSALVEPRSDACTYCHRQSLCRIDDLR